MADDGHRPHLPEHAAQADHGAEGSTVRRGAEEIAANATVFATPDRVEDPVLVNGQAGAVIQIDGRPISVMAFTVTEGRIVAIDVLADPRRVSTTVNGLP